ncbi:phenoloxidase-activating enzyme 1-like [Aphidius gifuensis]|uniref:phenoloxidase-activating enzyme 1-like n=1 Tax=Aphidius gifuensis TaxID=684658 RepID=UPI001CDD8E96|nr:phenoloxidase-activating enzyme 1-like [Aphidius gifuensis]
MIVASGRMKIQVHRFRQAVCGYVGINPKVCCNSPREMENFYPTNFDSKSECGKSLVKSNIVTIGSYPFIARIGFINLNNGIVNYTCTGTIINERTILTTASCALETHQDYILHSVLLGEFDTNTNPDCNIIFCAHCTKSYNVSFVIKHPNYNPQTLARNIALIRLDEAVSFTLTIQPICYSTRQLITVGSLSLLVGWGKASIDQDEITNEQRALPMELLPIGHCTEFVDKGINVEMCAIGQQVPCSNFNGSPLIRRDENAYELVTHLKL